MEHNNAYDSSAERFSLLDLDDARSQTPLPLSVEESVTPDVAILEDELRRSDLPSSERRFYHKQGTPVEDREAMRRGRRAWDDLPIARDATEDHATRVRETERRRDATVDLRTVHVTQNGQLWRGGGYLRPTRRSWGQLSRMSPQGTEIPHNLNSWMPESASSSGSDREALFRTRMGPNGRELFAALSPRYAVADGHVVARAIANRLPSDARARINYDAEKTRHRVDFSLINPYEAPDEMVVGNLHTLHLTYSTRDDGGASHALNFRVERISCSNTMVVPMQIAGLKVRHVGDAASLWDKAAGVLGHAERIMNEFSDHWADARTRVVFAEGGDPADVFSQVVKNGVLRIDGVSDTALIKRLVAAYEDEPGSSYQAVINAVTRSAHQDPWSFEASEQLEEQAGRMLWQTVSVCDRFFN